MRRRAFTLVELIVAVVVGAALAGATTTAMVSFVRGKARATARHEAFRRAETAVSRMALDIASAIRDRDPSACRITITDSAGGVSESDGLNLLVRSVAPVRPAAQAPEGADREVQYKLFPSPAGQPGTMALWRRCQPGVDDYMDAGGVATPVVDGIASLSIRACDSAQWFDSWDSDSSGMPHAVSVTAVGISDDGNVRASARRVVALDRTPIPPASTDTSTTGSSSTTGGGR
jgi:type II secretion system protein J